MRERIGRDACLVIGGVAFALALSEVYIGWAYKGWFTALPDYDVCMNAAQRWLATGAYFPLRQLDGPYEHLFDDVLYPPVTLWLFVPLSFLPVWAWFAIPVTVMAAALWRLRPALWGWALMAVLLCDPSPLGELVFGNPLWWFMAIEFAAVAWRWPASLALFKPSLFPFALFGIRERRWWLGAGALALLSLPFLPLTFTWARVVLDSQGTGGLLYSLLEFPYALIPLVAWLSSRTRNSSSSQLLPERTAAAI
jgi:hypothetical protein